MSASGVEPLVTAVSVFYNRGAFVKDSVGSLLQQTLPELEILIVDDGSTDNTAEELRGLDDPRLKALIQPNGGFTRAMNGAIAQARGKYIAVHGSGDISLPERLAKQAAYLDANPDVGVIGCAIQSRGRVWKGGDAKEPLLPRVLKSNPFTHGEVMFRRDLFEKVGGYRELFRFAQDRDLWLRMGRHCNYYVLPDVLYERYYLPGGVGRDPEKVFLQKKLADFAVQCAETADANGRDLLDQHGPLGLLLARPSAKLGRSLAAMGLRWFRDGRFPEGAILINHARNESASLLTVGASLLSSVVTAVPALQRPLQRVMQKMTRISDDGVLKSSSASQTEAPASADQGQPGGTAASL